MKKLTNLIILCAVIFTLSACGLGGEVTTTQPRSTALNSEPELSEQISETAFRAEEILEDMTLEEKVWQMFFVKPEDITDIDVAVQAGDATRQALEDCPVGGIIYFAQNIKSAEQISEMISNSQSYSKIPLFISVDEEGGRVSRLGDAGIIEKLPPMAEIGAMGDKGIEKARDAGAYLGTQLTALGFNMDFAPVADVITVENNEDIGDRSFGTDPTLVSKMVAAEVEGMQSNNLCATLKHFPSNGSTETNTHTGVGISTRTIEEMRETEFLPFKAGIEAGADIVMIAHMAAVNIVGDETPSSLSSVIIQDYLRGELGFQKVVITDALNMGAITAVYSPSEAAVEAVKAGADLLLMSPDVKTAVQAVVDKVKSGEISEDRINESVLRILALKEERGIL